VPILESSMESITRYLVRIGDKMIWLADAGVRPDGEKFHPRS
jgi:hypothetical protein